MPGQGPGQVTGPTPPTSLRPGRGGSRFRKALGPPKKLETDEKHGCLDERQKHTKTASRSAPTFHAASCCLLLSHHSLFKYGVGGVKGAPHTGSQVNLETTFGSKLVSCEHSGLQSPAQCCRELASRLHGGLEGHVPVRHVWP